MNANPLNYHGDDLYEVCILICWEKLAMKGMLPIYYF